MRWVQESFGGDTPRGTYAEKFLTEIFQIICGEIIDEHLDKFKKNKEIAAMSREIPT